MNLFRDNSTYPLVIYKGWQCIVRPVLYSDGNPGLVLEDIDDGSAVATCTVNLPEQMVTLAESIGYGAKLDVPTDTLFVFIKDYSENEGMLKLLQEQGIVDDPVYGMYGIPRCMYGSSGYIEQIPFQYICHDGLKEQFEKLYIETQDEQPFSESYREPDYA